MRRTIYAVEVTLTKVEYDEPDMNRIARPADRTPLLAHYDGSLSEAHALALYADLDERIKREHMK